MGPAIIKSYVRHLLAIAKAIPELPRLTELTKQSAPLLALADTASSLVEQHSNLRKHSPTLASIDELLHSLIAGCPKRNGSRSLDLGCGERPRNPFGAEEFFGLDIRDDLGHNILCANLATEPIPSESNSFDFCTAFDVIEHIPRILACDGGTCTRFPFIELMNEIHRVLKPGGLFLHQTPAFPCKQAFQDPTHVNIITEDTFPYYFCEPNLYAGKIGYGFTGSFELVHQSWLETAWIVGVLKAVKG